MITLLPFKLFPHGIKLVSLPALLLEKADTMQSYAAGWVNFDERVLGQHGCLAL